MANNKNLDVNSRRDLDLIAALVKQNDRVLDLGCGDGSFLKRLVDEKDADVLGLEIDQPTVARCIANGVPVIQGNMDQPLDFADDKSFDLVVLSRTIQEIRRPDELLQQIVRVGKKAAVSVINFGHWNNRCQLLFSGKMPRNSQIPYHWYDTPNIHLGTLQDFRELCAKLDITIVEETPIATRFPKLTKIMPNLFAVGAVFVIEKN